VLRLLLDRDVDIAVGARATLWLCLSVEGEQPNCMKTLTRRPGNSRTSY